MDMSLIFCNFAIINIDNDTEKQKLFDFSSYNSYCNLFCYVNISYNTPSIICFRK